MYSYLYTLAPIAFFTFVLGVNVNSSSKMMIMVDNG